MGLSRFERLTSPLSGVRSNQLSYRPLISMSKATLRLLRQKTAPHPEPAPPWIYKIRIIKSKRSPARLASSEGICGRRYRRYLRANQQPGLSIQWRDQRSSVRQCGLFRINGTSGRDAKEKQKQTIRTSRRMLLLPTQQQTRRLEAELLPFFSLERR